MNNKGCGWQRNLKFDKPEFYYILGALLGDGRISLESSRLGCKSRSFAVAFKRKSETMGLRAYFTRRFEDGHFKYFQVCLNSRELLRKGYKVV